MCRIGDSEPKELTVFERWESMRWGRDVESALLLVDSEGALRRDKVVAAALRRRERAAEAVTARIAQMARAT